jgi:hypothetical protein
MFLLSDSDKRHRMAFITPFTFIHFLNGIIFYIASVQLLKYDFNKSFIIWFLIHLFYECKDFTLSYIMEEGSHSYNNNNSYLNSLGDQIFAMLGFLVGQYLPLFSPRQFIFLIIFTIVLARIFYYNQLG